METRRSFIKKSGLLTAGTIFLTSCSSGGTKAKPVGIQLYTVRNQINDDLEGTLNRIAEIGYRQVETAGHVNGKYYGKTAREFGELLKSLNLTPVSGHYSTGIINNTEKGTLSNGWDEALDEMNELGQKYAVLGYLREEERTSMDDYKKVLDLLNKAGEKAKANGIQLCYHNHDFEFINLEGKVPMYYILDNTDADILQMELDLFWITKAGYNIKDFFTKYKGRVPLWHVKDMDDKGDFTEVGSGKVDFKLAFDNMNLAGMKHFFVEQDQSKDPLKSIEKSFKYTNENLI